MLNFIDVTSLEEYKDGNKTNWGLFQDSVDNVFRALKGLELSVVPFLDCFKQDIRKVDLFVQQVMDLIVTWIAPTPPKQTRTFIVINIVCKL